MKSGERVLVLTCYIRYAAKIATNVYFWKYLFDITMNVQVLVMQTGSEC